MADLFYAITEIPAEISAVQGCGRAGCIGSGAPGNICFFGDAGLRGYCRDQAKLKLRALAVELGALPSEQRVHRLDRLAFKGWKPDVLEWLARRSAGAP